MSYTKLLVCDNEFFKIDLAVSTSQEQRGRALDFVVTNLSSKPICGDLFICSSALGKYKECINLLVNEQVSIRGYSNNVDKSFAYIRVTDKDWVISNSVKTEAASWIYGLTFGTFNLTPSTIMENFGIVNTNASESDAKNVTVFIPFYDNVLNQYNVTLREPNINTTSNGTVTIKSDGIYIFFETLKIGEIRNFEFVYPPNYFADRSPIVHIKSDTPFKYQDGSAII